MPKKIKPPKNKYVLTRNCLRCRINAFLGENGYCKNCEIYVRTMKVQAEQRKKYEAAMATVPNRRINSELSRG